MSRYYYRDRKTATRATICTLLQRDLFETWLRRYPAHWIVGLGGSARCALANYLHDMTGMAIRMNGPFVVVEQQRFIVPRLWVLLFMADFDSHAKQQRGLGVTAGEALELLKPIWRWSECRPPQDPRRPALRHDHRPTGQPADYDSRAAAPMSR